MTPMDEVTEAARRAAKAVYEKTYLDLIRLGFSEECARCEAIAAAADAEDEELGV